MTKFKEYLRSKETEPEYDVTAPYNLSDFEINTCAGIETTVETRIMNGCIVVVTYSNIAEPEYAVYDRYGACNYYDSVDYHAYVGNTHCDPEFTDWLYDNGFTDRAVNHLMIHYSPLYSSYSVYAAFLHVRAGIMDEAAFYKLVNKRYQQAINF